MYQCSFKVGNSVRKKLKTASFKKGYKQIWSERIHKIAEINTTGVKAKLNNGETVRLEDLLLVPEPESEPEPATAVENVEKQHKIEQVIKHKEGLDSSNIIESRRRSERKSYNLRQRKK